MHVRSVMKHSQQQLIVKHMCGLFLLKINLKEDFRGELSALRKEERMASVVSGITDLDVLMETSVGFYMRMLHSVVFKRDVETQQAANTSMKDFQCQPLLLLLF